MTNNEFFGVLDAAEAEEKAKSERIEMGLDDSQRWISYGVKVLLLTPSVVKQQIVVGRVLNKADLEEARKLSVLAEFRTFPNEPIPSVEEVAAQQEKGFRTVLFFSPDYPSGFHRTVHISRLFPLTDEEFQHFKDAEYEPAQMIGQTWYRDVENNLATALETRPDSPYRKRCENPTCGSGRIVLAKACDIITYAPTTMKPNATGFDLLTGHIVGSTLENVNKRFFKCLDCNWESEPLDERQWTENHHCVEGGSVFEELYGIKDDNVV